MSGHSKWSTIKRKKGANDAKRGKLFAKLIRGIEVAAKNGGADPNNNAALYQAISKAKSNSVPNSNICLLYTSPSPRDRTRSRMPSSA